MPRLDCILSICPVARFILRSTDYTGRKIKKLQDSRMHETAQHLAQPNPASSRSLPLCTNIAEMNLPDHYYYALFEMGPFWVCGDEVFRSPYHPFKGFLSYFPGLVHTTSTGRFECTHRAVPRLQYTSPTLQDRAV